MGIPGSKVVFTTGIQTKEVGLTVSITQYKIDTVTWDFKESIANVKIQKGYVDPVTGLDVFLDVIPLYPIDNTPGVTRVLDGVSHLVPSGTHYDDLAATAPTGEDLQEELEDGLFASMEAMGYFSGTETV